MTQDRESLKRLAEAATPGPWSQFDNVAPYGPSYNGGVWGPGGPGYGLVADCQGCGAPDGRSANAKYIAATSPKTTLSLLSDLDARDARIRELEKALKPFAEAAGHLHPSHADDATTLDGIEAGHWRQAARALNKEGQG